MKMYAQVAITKQETTKSNNTTAQYEQNKKPQRLHTLQLRIGLCPLTVLTTLLYHTVGGQT